MKTDDYLNYLKQQANNIVDSSTGFCHACKGTIKHHEYCIAPMLKKTALYVIDEEMNDIVHYGCDSLKDLAQGLADIGITTDSHRTRKCVIRIPLYSDIKIDMDAELHTAMIDVELGDLIETIKIEKAKELEQLEKIKEDYSEKGYQKQLDRINSEYDQRIKSIRK